jgi:gas vesicle protein
VRDVPVSDWQVRNSACRFSSELALPAAIGGYMINQQRRIDDPEDPRSASRRRGGGGAGSLLLATMLGVGLGLLAAPQPGSKTRKLLLNRLAALGEGVEGSLEEVQDLSSKAKKRARQRLERLREDAEEGLETVDERWQHAKHRLRHLDEDESDSSPLGTILALAAGVAATYFLTSDRAAPVRSKVQHVAGDVRRRATDEWDRFQRGGFRGAKEGSAGEGRSETRAGSTPSDEAPQAS